MLHCRQDKQWLGTAIIGSRPNHPFLTTLVDGIGRRSCRNREQSRTSRPDRNTVTARHLDDLRDHHAAPVAVFPSTLFYPYHFSEPERHGGPFPNWVRGARVVDELDGRWFRRRESTASTSLHLALTLGGTERPLDGTDVPEVVQPLHLPVAARDRTRITPAARKRNASSSSEAARMAVGNLGTCPVRANCR